jgi:transcriptional regulator with XRE-family HTH domain
MTAHRARVLGDLSKTGPVRLVTSRPGLAEREHLAGSLGVLLRELRTEHGMGTRLLARRAAVARSTITRLEAGERRPRRSLLAGIAYGLNPDDPTPITEALAAAAGESLVPEGPWSEQRRRRAMDRAVLSGAAPLPGGLAESLALHRQADDAYRRALKMFDEPGAYDDVRKLEEIMRLMDLARTLGAQAGPPIILQIGRRRISAGFSHP